MPMADWLGYAASLAVLTTFLMRTMQPLRLVAILSNVLFVAYGYIDHIQPVFLLHLTLLPINLWRLVVHWNDARPPAARRRGTASPYVLWFAAGVVAGLLSPLPILFLVGKSEASKLGLSSIAASAVSSLPAGTRAPLAP
jgi:predicted ABC-type exoprotein transport system permease subunit